MVSQKRGVLRDGSFCTDEYPATKTRNEMQPIKSRAPSCACIDREGGGVRLEMKDRVGLKLNFTLEPQVFRFLSSGVRP